MERRTGLEPATLGLGSQCSTNWATAASNSPHNRRRNKVNQKNSPARQYEGKNWGESGYVWCLMFDWNKQPGDNYECSTRLNYSSVDFFLETESWYNELSGDREEKTSSSEMKATYSLQRWQSKREVIVVEVFRGAINRTRPSLKALWYLSGTFL